MLRFQRICASAAIIAVLTSCGGTPTTASSTPTPPDMTATPTASATAPSAPPTATSSITATTTPSVTATANAGAGGTSASQATTTPASAPTAPASATPTATALPATSPTGWRYRDPNFPGQLFHFAGVRCGTPADLSGEWQISDTKVVEGVPISEMYTVAVDANQRTGTWLNEQSFEAEGVKNVGGYAGSLARITLNEDGSVTFTMNVGTPIEGKIITPDGEYPYSSPFPFTAPLEMSWDPIYGACP